MNRLQKKCFVFSVGLHGLVAVILLGSVAFRSKSEETDAPVLSMIPANIIDAAGAGGGEPAPAMRPMPTPAPPRPQSQPAAPKPETQPAAVPPQPRMIQPETIRRQERAAREQPEEDARPVAASENPLPRPSRKHHQHEIHPTFVTANATTTSHRASRSEDTQESSRAAAQSEAHRLNEIESSLDHLASGVQASGAARTVVDVPGISGGGEVFAGYRDIVRAYYYRAWIQPDNGADKSALPEAQIVVARDGTIIKAELVSPSGERSLDKSVERALQMVSRLPPFPAESHDEQKTFRIQFSLEFKQATG